MIANMLNFKVEWEIFAIILLAYTVSVDSRNCKAQLDCNKSECCVISGFEYKAIGKCQKLSEKGRSCSNPAEQLKSHGGKYVSSCPCEKGLVCQNMLNVKIKTILSICSNETPKNAGTNHKIKRDVYDVWVEDPPSTETESDYNLDDDAKDIPLHDDTLHEDSTEASINWESESTTEDTAVDEHLKELWDNAEPIEFTNWDSDEPMSVESDKLPLVEEDKPSPVTDDTHISETITEKDSEGNEAEGDLKNIIQGMLHSANKQPENDAILHSEVDRSTEEPVENYPDFSHTDSPVEIDWQGTTAQSATTLNYMNIIKFLQDAMNSGNKFGAKDNLGGSSGSRKSDMSIQKPKINAPILNEHGRGEVIFPRTKSPLEAEWDESTIESELTEHQLKTPTKQEEANEAPGSANASKTPVANKESPKSESESNLFHNMEIVKDGQIPSMPELDHESPHDESLIQIHYSKEDHEKHNYEDTDDDNLDYMDEF